MIVDAKNLATTDFDYSSPLTPESFSNHDHDPQLVRISFIGNSRRPFARLPRTFARTL